MKNYRGEAGLGWWLLALSTAILACGGGGSGPATPLDLGGGAPDASPPMGDAGQETASDGAETGVAANPFKPANLESLAATLSQFAVTGPLQTGATGDPSRVPLAMITNSNSPFWGAFQIGVGRAASKLGCPSSVTLLGNPPVGMTRADLQAGMFQDAIDQAYLGVGISPSTATPGDETRFGTLVAAENAAKGNVITFDSDLPDSGRALYIGTDNYNAGLAYGKEMIRVMNGTGKAIPFSTVDTPNIRARLQGAKDALVGTTITMAELVVVVAPATPQAAAQKVIVDNPDMNAFASLSTNSGPGCAKAVIANNKVGAIKIISFDTPSETQAFVKSGVIAVTVGQRAYWEGFLVTYALYAMSQQGKEATMNTLMPWLAGPKKDLIDTGIDVLTKDNLATYAAYLESIGILTQ